MDNIQAEAIANELLRSGLDARTELQRKRFAKMQRQKRAQLIVGPTFIAAFVGATISYLMGESIAKGCLFGAVAGSAVGWLLVRLLISLPKGD
jgi:NhaP-type Na+/H+ or K+/H+ antiporter